MIFFFDAHGVPLRITPDRVFQGSNKANTIYFVCPTSPTNTVSVSFKLPNNEYTTPYQLELEKGNNEYTTSYPLTLEEGNINGVMDESKAFYGLWSLDLPVAITTYPGRVTCQFAIIHPDGVVNKTDEVTFLVEDGVELIEPEQGDSYQEVLRNISAILTTLNNQVEKIDNLELMVISEAGRTDTIEVRLGIQSDELIETDNKVNKANEEIKLIKTILEDTVITDTKVEDTYMYRQTAGGLDIVDAVQTKVEKIQGNTVLSKNYMPFNGINVSSQGVTVVGVENGEDSYYSFNGTSTDPFSLRVGEITLPIGRYYLSGGSDKVTIKLNSPSLGLIIDNGAGHPFTLTQETTFSVELQGPAMTDFTGMHLYAKVRQNGIYNSYFKGIKSYGRNLFNFDAAVSNTYPLSKIKNADGSYTITYSGNSNYGDFNMQPISIPKGTKVYVRYEITYNSDYNRPTGGSYLQLGCHLRKKSGGSQFCSYGQITTADDDIIGISVYFTNNSGGTLPAEICTVKNFYLELGDITTHEYTPYVEPDTSFELSNTVELNRYDYIDVPNKKLVKQTGILTQETDFTEEELIEYSEFILTADKKTIYYKLETPVQSYIDIPDGYLAYKDGVENIVQGDIDNSANGAVPTIIQNYYVKVGG